jgi:hypothetical protein
MLPATTKKQREPMYGDLIQLLSPGFLSTTARCGDLSIGIRSLQSADMELLRVAARENNPDWPLWVSAASIWMLDGYPLLECYPTSTRVLYDFLARSHKSLVRAVFTRVLTLFERVRRTNLVMESYLYEEDSRRFWKSARLNPQTTLASYPGAERLGTNSFQGVWMEWNQYEDTRIEEEYSWSLTKVLVSVQASKGSKKLDAKDKARNDREKSRRSEVQDRAYYKWVGLLDENDQAKADTTTEVFQPRTAAELSEEMRRWVAGEKDFHDRVVDDYKDRVKREMEEKETSQQRALEEAQARRAKEEQETGFSRPALVAYTPEQLAKLVPERARPGAKFIIEADPASRTYNRYLRDDLKSGALKVEDGRIVVYKPPSEEGDGRPSLNDLIAGRKPSING